MAESSSSGGGGGGEHLKLLTRLKYWKGGAEEISHLVTVPTILNALLNENLEKATQLHTIISSGEALPAPVPRLTREQRRGKPAEPAGMCTLPPPLPPLRLVCLLTHC